MNQRIPAFATTLLACLALSPGVTSAQGAQTGTVVGRVVDSATNLPRRGATGTIVATGQAGTTNDRGRFVLARVPGGEQTLRVNAFSFQVVSRNIIVRAGDTTNVEIALVRDPTMLDAVKAVASSPERELFFSAPSVGAVTLNAAAMQSVPRLGEADVVRVVQLLPGVLAKNDFSTGYSVHGGETDQNLVLLDDYPIYNPFHLGGLFSTFISPTVHDVQLLSSSFPSQYGGRLSSVLDVTSAEETRAGVHGTADVSVLASTVTLGSTFGDGRGSWMIAGRRTYADEVAKLVSAQAIPYHFRDEQARLAYQLPSDWKLSVTAYDGRDVLDGSFSTFGDSTNRGASGGAFNYSWGNLVGGATLTKTMDASARLPLFGWSLGDSSKFETRISASRFSTFLDLGSGSETIQNSVRDSRVGGSFTSYTAAHDRTVGYEVAKYDVQYTTVADANSLDNIQRAQTPISGAAYFNDLWRPAPSWLLSTGARFEAVSGRNWSAVSPRVSVKYLASGNSAFTASVGKFAQWTHSLSLEDNPIRLFDYWQGTDSTTPVSTAWQYVVGHERWLNASRFIKIEAFYKRYDNLLEYNPNEDPQVVGDEFINVRGMSYGADLLVRQVEAGPFSGWLSYTYQLSTRQHDSVRYSPAQDLRNDLNVVVSWRVRSFVTGARFGYASGMPYTDALTTLPRRFWDPLTNQYGTQQRVEYDILGGLRNGDRLPPTHRVDLYVERQFGVRGASMTPYLSVVNAFNAKNVLYYEYDQSRSPAIRQTVTQLPILPSVGLSLAF